MDLSSILYRVWTAYSTGWGLWVSFGMYFWLSICLMIIARKVHVGGWWAGWIPVMNFKVMCAAAKSSGACFWRLFIVLLALVAGIALWIPVWIAAWLVLGAIVWVITWSRICRERHYPPVLGLLSVIPVLNLVLFGILAFGDQPYMLG